MRKLIDFYPGLLNEVTAGEEAKRRGLKSIGFGRYADPSTNKVVAKSVNGKLTAVKGADAGKKKPTKPGKQSLATINKLLKRFKSDTTQLTPAAQKQREKVMRDLEKQKAKLTRDHPIGKKLGVDLPSKALKGGKEGHMKLAKKLAKLPLSKLRSAQTKLDRVLQKLYADKNISGMETAQLVQDILTAAVDEREFGEKDRKAAGIKSQGSSPARAGAMKAIRKVFGGKGQVGMLQKDKVIDGQRQIWVDVSRAADSLNIRTQSQYETWLKRKQNAMKKTIAANPSLEGFVPVFKQGPQGSGVSMVLVREE